MGKPSSVLSLGNGGFITLKFEKKIYSKSGPEVRIFENPMYLMDSETQKPDKFRSFTELAYVEVSQDGKTFYRFPHSIREGEAIEFLVNPYNLKGLAGAFPVYANKRVSPFGPQVLEEDGTRKVGAGPGGDDFDLEAQNSLILGTSYYLEASVELSEDLALYTSARLLEEEHPASRPVALVVHVLR